MNTICRACRTVSERAWRGSVILLLLLSSPEVASSRTLSPPWIQVGVDAALSRVRSVVVERRDAPLKLGPDGDSASRGSAEMLARLPFFGAALGPGCASPWLLVGAAAWLCGDDARLSALPIGPDGSREPDISAHSFAPRFFVRDNGTFGYRVLRTAELGPFDGQIAPGLGITVKRIEAGPRGDPFGLTTHGLWVPLRDLVPTQPSTFAGVELDRGALVGWIGANTAFEYRKPGQLLVPRKGLPRRSAFAVYEQVRARGKTWLRIGDQRWVKATDTVLARPVLAPTTVRPDERWIDVELRSQILTLYQGAQAVYATLVSTGRAMRGPLATPVGEFRIWVKLVSHDMDNLDDPEAEERYGLESVPWVMFFHRGYGLHGTFWHDSFGERRSHGCINLTLADAKRVFDWVSPKVHSGWSAALPTPYELGTLVRVR